MYVNVYDVKSHALLGSLIRVQDPPQNMYGLYSLDMTPYVGRKVNVKFIRYHNSTGSGGDWSLDDITLTVQ